MEKDETRVLLHHFAVPALQVLKSGRGPLSLRLSALKRGSLIGGIDDIALSSVIVLVVPLFWRPQALGIRGRSMWP